MVFVAPVHPLWWLVRRSIQLLTGAVMLAAIMGSGYAAADRSTGDTTYADRSITEWSIADRSELTVSAAQSATVSISPLIEVRPAARCVDLAEPMAHPAEPTQQVLLTQTFVCRFAGRHAVAALGERAPPRR